MTVAQIKVETPRVPNFLKFKEISGKISIAQLTEPDLRDIGEAWTEKLIQRAAEIRKADPRSWKPGS